MTKETRQTLGLCVLAYYAAIFAQAVPLIRRESVEADDAGVLEPGIDSAIKIYYNEMSKSKEAARLWMHFKVLDDRFDEAVTKYMTAAQRGIEKLAVAVAQNPAPVPATKKEEEHMKPMVHESSKADAKALVQESSKMDAKAPVQESSKKDNPRLLPYGFYVHAFFEAAAVVNQLRSIRKFYPEAPVYVMSDGGANFSGICSAIGNCNFAWRAGAHDCWNPKPFLDRLREGAQWLQSQNAEFTIFLEPDVTLHKRASRPLREGVDAGGLRDDWNPSLPIQLRELAQDLGRKFSGKKDFTISWPNFGLAGGSIIRTRAAILAFKPDYINWLEFEKLYNKEVYSSDIAMLIALAAHGFDYYPWEEVSQPGNRPQYNHSTAFQHHSSGEKGGKPFYGHSLAKEDKYLVGPPPKSMQPLPSSEYPCQHCVWVDEAECWPRNMGGRSNRSIIECPAVDEKAFRSQNWTFKVAPQPHLFKVFF